MRKERRCSSWSQIQMEVAGRARNRSCFLEGLSMSVHQPNVRVELLAFGAVLCRVAPVVH